MATSALYWQLCRQYREQKRETLQRATNIRESFAVNARCHGGEYDRAAVAAYLRANPAATDREVQHALSVYDRAAVAAVRAECSVEVSGV